MENELIPTKEKESGFDPERINLFLKDNEAFLSNNAKKGVFFLGALVRHLLNIQLRELDGNSPFEKKLKGYDLNASDLQRIYTEAFGKLTQYKEKKYGFPTTLLEYVKTYFNLCFSEIQQMSSNEVSFYFISGTQFIDRLKFPKSESSNKF